MKRLLPTCDVDRRTGQVVAVFADRTVPCVVPLVFGEVLSAEVRGDFIVAVTARGKASFHAQPPLAGKMPWHAMRKAFRALCLVEALDGRVDFHVTHHRYRNGGLSSVGASGRVVIDGAIVCKGVADPGPGEFAPRDLGAALAAYLNLTPAAALEGEDWIVRALALLDRRTSDAEILALGPAQNSDPLWLAFHRLRRSVIPSPKLG